MLTTLLRFIKLRFVGFSLVGLGVMIEGIALLYVLVNFCGVDQNIAYLLQAFASIETSFVLNRWLNWNDRSGNIWLQLLKFNISKLGIVALNQIIFVFLVSRGVHYLLVAILGVTVATIINYFINDRFVFTSGTLYSQARNGSASIIPTQHRPLNPEIALEAKRDKVAI